jgi:hypothetical protein
MFCMNTQPRKRVQVAGYVAFLCALAWLSPGNSQERRWGAFEVFADGQWRCLAGYHREGSFCVPATAPAHAAYVGDGSHWECDWGFQKIGASCEEIKPPAHAYLDASGRDWVCYPGFERKSDQCVPKEAG